MAQVAAEYLKQAGFAVDLQVVDWATLTQRRGDPALWDIYITHSPFLPEPALIGPLSESSPGLVVDAGTQAGGRCLQLESDPQSASPLGRGAEGHLRRNAEHQDRRLQRPVAHVAEAGRRAVAALAVFLERASR